MAAAPPPNPLSDVGTAAAADAARTTSPRRLNFASRCDECGTWFHASPDAPAPAPGAAPAAPAGGCTHCFAPKSVRPVRGDGRVVGQAFYKEVAAWSRGQRGVTDGAPVLSSVFTAEDAAECAPECTVAQLFLATNPNGCANDAVEVGYANRAKLTREVATAADVDRGNMIAMRWFAGVGVPFRAMTPALVALWQDEEDEL